MSHNSAPQDRCDRGTLGDGAAPSYLESLKWVAFISKFTRAYQTFFVGVNFYIFHKIKFYFLSKLWFCNILDSFNEMTYVYYETMKV